MSDFSTPTVDPYHAIAELYDLEHDAFHDDIDLLLSLADAVGGPVLEMGCGSGRVLAPLAETGHHVTGLDRSEAMLDRARRRIKHAGVEDTVTLVHGEMRDATTAGPGAFGLVAFTLNALMHLETPEQQVAALANAGKALAPTGQVVIDVANPSPEYLVRLGAAPILEGSWKLDDGTVVDKVAVREIDSVRQAIETVIWYDRTLPDGQLERHRSQFTLRYVHANELQLMLAAAGFARANLYGSHELDPLTEASERIVAIAGLAGAPAIEATLDMTMVQEVL